jgi:hypothetical protein
VDVLALLEVRGELLRAVRVVVAVAVAGAADPAVLHQVGLGVPERVDQAVPVGQAAVEVVLEPAERGVARLVVGLDHVEVAEQDGLRAGVGQATAAEGGGELGQPAALALGAVRGGVAGGGVGAEHADEPHAGGDEDAGRPLLEERQVRADRVDLDGQPADDHHAVLGRPRLRVDHGVAGRAEGVGEVAAAVGGSGLGQHEDVLGPRREPGQLAVGALLRGAADVEGHQAEAGHVARS